MKYVDEKQRLIFVSAGLGGDQYMTMYQDYGKWDSSGAHRLVSKELPIRETEAEAQADLDAYAMRRGWLPYCDKRWCPLHDCFINQCCAINVLSNNKEIYNEFIKSCPFPVVVKYIGGLRG